jgi:ferric-dicitrate binding protein FerR (iron transport regulator)
MIGTSTERDALARFEALLDAYGAEPRRWPADRRAAAEAFLARSSEAQALHAAAARLDALIDTAAIEPAPAHLVGRAIAAAPQPRARGSWFGGLLRPAAGLAFAAVLGLGLGGLVSPFGAGNGELADADSATYAIADVSEFEL